jgi:FkbM family methyltransferase
MSIVDRTGAASPQNGSPGSPQAAAKLDLASGVIGSTALQSELSHHIATARLAIAQQGGERALLIPGHQPVRVSYADPRAPDHSSHIYEETTTLVLSYLIDRFHTAMVFDVGAGVGYFSRIAASRQSSDVTAHAFEMRPDRLALLKASLATDPFASRVHAHLSGLTDAHKGEHEVQYTSSILFESSPRTRDYRELWRWLKLVLRGGVKRDLASATILMTSVDHFAAAHAAPPDVIKIDVDGYEGRVLDGAAQTLARDKPFVLLELHKDKKLRYGVRRKDVAELLFRAGYHGLFFTDHQDRLKCKIVEVGRDHPLIDRQETDLILFYHPDYLSTRPSVAR